VKHDIAQEDRVLEYRRKGKSFAKIASVVGLASAKDALAAYRRARNRCSEPEQAELRASERQRCDDRASIVRADKSLSAAEMKARLGKIERLRAALG
jgi:hypothetical protein